MGVRNLAGRMKRRHTANMRVPIKRGLLTLAVFAGAMSVVVLSAHGDEIRLKDGKKLYGVIVAYEDNMFKVKTDYGFVLVEKDKIASIVPSTPATPKTEPSAKKETTPTTAKPGVDSQPAPESTVASSTETAPTPTNASAKSVVPAAPEKREKAAPKITNAAVKPELPTPVAENAAAPAMGGPKVAATSGLAAPATPPAPPKEPEVPANREEILGNLYTNHTHGFRMYKAPSWNLLNDARQALPNAIVAMGTSNESTLMVVGQEKTKEPFEAAATTVEKRLREIYTNYRQISQRKSTVGGLSAVEFHYRGQADEHDWSGTLVVISHGTDIFTVLGMTYADSDLIQIQENVIAKTIASIDFSAH
jgi:hypothetical protein